MNREQVREAIDIISRGGLWKSQIDSLTDAIMALSDKPPTVTRKRIDGIIYDSVAAQATTMVCDFLTDKVKAEICDYLTAQGVNVEDE